jgi:TldD protein
VKWDDEGVVPDEFTLVKDGILVDYQTTRDQVAWLAPYYEKAGRPMRSHGCAMASDASQITMQNLPNLQMMPDTRETSFTDLVTGTKKGVALLDVAFIMMDPQQLNGTVVGTVREIKNGKLGRVLNGAALVFRAPELWKSLDAIGGASSTCWSGRMSFKGQPMQQTMHSVGAVPARFKNAGITDFTRKA